ncbi:MAG: FecR domain-containing protein [Chitinophagales bacterium]|nr:FecR domain-containing protein [Chitinophagales bacterium]
MLVSPLQEEKEAMDFLKYLQLFSQREKGNIDSKNQAALNQWLSEGDRADMDKDYQKVWALSGKYKSSYEPDVDKGLALFQERLAQGAPSQKEEAIVRRLPGRILAIAASLALLLAAGWWVLNRDYVSDASGLVAYETQIEQKESFELPDGTEVILNENSSLTYDTDYEKNPERRVTLIGEAYFKVQPDADHPFQIKAGNSEVVVLGTAFNLRAYPHEDFMEVEVEEGKVAFSSEKGEQSVKLTANQKGIYLSKQEQIIVQENTGLNTHAWRTQNLHFRDTPIDLVISDIARFYDVDIALKNTENLNCGLTAVFKGEQLEDVLEVIKLALDVEISTLASGGIIVKVNGC